MRAAIHIKVLSEIFDVTLAIIGHNGNEAEVHRRLTSDVRACCVSVVVISRVALIHRLLRRTRSNWARFLFEVLWSTPVEVASCRLAIGELGRHLAGQVFDVVHCFRLYTASLQLLERRNVKIGRSVLDLDDYESKAAFRSSAALRDSIGVKLSALSWTRAIKWWALESILIPNFDDALVCSELDQETLRRRFPRINWHIVPNVVNAPSQFVPLGRDQFTFLFVGRFDHVPNFDAANFFCTTVLPLLRQKAPERFRVVIAGAAGNDISMLMVNEEVQVAIDPPDLLSYYAQSDAVVVPLRSGGGTRIKILEALSYGLPVISTSVGAEGLDVTPGADIMIADNAEAFAEQCMRIWLDAPLRRRIAASGYELWRRKYSPLALTEALDVVYGESNSNTWTHSTVMST
jgi:glycosyltransferase involved in cell wall biosynthesis